jgi:hypothetical protein
MKAGILGLSLVGKSTPLVKDGSAIRLRLAV